MAVYDTGAILRYWEDCPKDKISVAQKYEIRRRRGSLQTMLGRYIEKRRSAVFRELGKREGRDQLPAELNPLYRPLLTLSFARNKQRKVWSGAQLMYLAALDLDDPAYPCKYDLRGITVLHGYICDYLEKQDPDALFQGKDAEVLPLKIPPPSASDPWPETADAVPDSVPVDDPVAAEASVEVTTPRPPAATSPSPERGLSDPAPSWWNGDWAGLFRRLAHGHPRRRRVMSSAALVVFAFGLFHFGPADGWQVFQQTWWRGPATVQPRIIDDHDFDALNQLAAFLWREAQKRHNSLDELVVIADPLLQCRWHSDQSRALLILSQAAQMRGDYERAVGFAHKALPLFPQMRTPMPNDHRLAYLYQGTAHLFLGEPGAARAALESARRVRGAYQHGAALDHLESLLLFMEGRREPAIHLLEQNLLGCRDDVGVSLRNTLSLFLAVDGDLEQSAAYRLEARLLNRTIQNEFEASRNLLSEWIWTLKTGRSGPQTQHLVPADDSGFRSNLRLLAPYLDFETLGDPHGHYLKPGAESAGANLTPNP